MSGRSASRVLVAAFLLRSNVYLSTLVALPRLVEVLLAVYPLLVKALGRYDEEK